MPPKRRLSERATISDHGCGGSSDGPSPSSATSAWAEIGAPFETAKARLVLAEAHAGTGNASAADLERSTAARSFESFGASRWAARAATLRDLKGFRYIERMLTDPDREFHVLDLVAVEQGTLPTVGYVDADAAAGTTLDGQGLSALDEQAKAAYRQRLIEVDQDIDDADAANDIGRRELARRDREFLLAELGRSVGSDAERARTAVARSLRYALERPNSITLPPPPTSAAAWGRVPTAATRQTRRSRSTGRTDPWPGRRRDSGFSERGHRSAMWQHCRMPAPLMDRYPAIADLEKRAKRRIPTFSWEYLASGTGTEGTLRANIDAMAAVRLRPQLLKGLLEPVTTTTLFGVEYAAPIGIAPIGLSGLIWPGADLAFAEVAVEKNIPHTLSTVGTGKVEEVGPATQGRGWFQLYSPRDTDLRDKLLDRVAQSGFTTLVITADVPIASRRERQRRARVRVPPKIGPALITQSILRPAWAMGVLRNGLPRFRTLEEYVDRSTMKMTAGFVGASLGGTLGWEYLAEVRERWDGPIVVKGILDADDAARCLDTGADAVQVSNHGGRQLDGSITAIDALPDIVDRIGGRAPVLFDSGVRDGLDVARAIALGADFVFCGRAFMFGLAGLGPIGAAHAYDILHEGLVNVMHQTGCRRLDELGDRLVQESPTA